MKLKLLVVSAFLLLLSITCLPMVEKANDTDEFELGKEVSPSHIVFCPDSFDCPGMIDRDTYKKIVEQTVITCVDVFVVDLKANTYFVITRKDEPAKDSQWIPGGRQEKYESLEKTAQRKCKKEVGIDVKVHKVLGAWSTVFPRSCWNCPTHTTNVAVLAFCESNKCNLDGHHEQAHWLPLETLPGNGYLDLAYTEMIKALKAYKISQLHEAVLAQSEREIFEALANLKKFPEVSIDKRVEKKQLLERVLALSNTVTNRQIIELLLQAGATLPAHASNQIDPKNELHNLIVLSMREKLLKDADCFKYYSTYTTA